MIKLAANVTEILTNDTCRMMFGSRYHRWTMDVPSDFNMDSVEHMDTMIRMAMEVDISDIIKWVEANWVD
jgi:hypothetical protein